ncbi:hypothetical protein C5167_009613 [Papaver somniferum]|uniref:Serine-rich protein-like protein n=1 Tax=Papaver somniferum TaxID=3469 RepID=A0A4Y7K1V7_PAPSO|nr:hypothetical protein C5167_009613 [Papaver somniferum]
MAGKHNVIVPAEILVPKLDIAELRQQSPMGIMGSSSQSQSPRAGTSSPMGVSSPSMRNRLQKQASVRANCLCSPTTHAGSFRCRLHRNSELSRSGNSIGSKLSELVHVTDKATPLSDTLHAQ